MSIVKRMTAQVGSSGVVRGGLTCPHCHRQTRLVLMEGKEVCQLCGKSPTEK